MARPTKKQLRAKKDAERFTARQVAELERKAAEAAAIQDTYFSPMVLYVAR